MLTRAAAAAVGQAVTPALLRLLLPVMADEIVVGAPSVADPPFVVEDASYRKVPRPHRMCAAVEARPDFLRLSAKARWPSESAGAFVQCRGRAACRLSR